MTHPNKIVLEMANGGWKKRVGHQHHMPSLITLHGLFLLLINFWESCDCFLALPIQSNLGNASATKSIIYDHRALVMNGHRHFLISGSIHYPRSTPKMWPKLIELAKEGGLDVIQTYVFWGGHEKQRGKYYFEGRHDLVGFLKLVHDAGLYVNLRIGPYVCAEWNFGGLPEWLREIPGMEFRTYNRPFQVEMQRFVTYIVDKMKSNNLFYTQGGPIILSQVENEYGMIEGAYGDAGVQYVQWAGDMAINLNTSVPWIMCKQTDSPGSIIDTCNGFYCDHYIPNDYNKPKIWTENWSGWFHYWGIARPHRPVEDLAYATARFFQKGGSFMNYYMYHGGTNFGRTSAAGVTTSYDYDAPIDEYGEVRQPKWGHLKDLHAAIKLCEPALAAVDGEAIHWRLPGHDVEIYVYSGVYSNDTEEGSPSLSTLEGKILCAAFVSNSGLTEVTLDFLGQSYDLPAWSVSILPDCKNVVFNTAKVAAQTSLKQMVPASALEWESKSPFNDSPGTVSFMSDTRKGSNAEVNEDSKSDEDRSFLNATAPDSKGLNTWLFAREAVGGSRHGISHQGLLEQINMTHDLTDYVWYITTVNVSQYSNSSQNQTVASLDYIETSLTVETVRDIVYVFLNGKPPGGYPTWHGSRFKQPLTLLQPGNNTIALLSATTGLWYAGPFYEKEVGGLSGSVMLRGVHGVGDINLTESQWTHLVGLNGEELHNGSDCEVGVSSQLSWSNSEPLPVNEPLVWYKTTLAAPGGNSPVVLDMGSMRKGVAWINGHHLGRYWPAMYNPRNGSCDDECDYRGTYDADRKCVSECGQPSQRWYHVPREWLNSTGNLLVLFEEIGGNVTGVSISKQVLHTVCSHISETHPTSMSFKDPTHDERARYPELRLDCGNGYQIKRIDFASFGNPSGKCGNFATGDCHAPRSMDVVKEACEGRQFCFLQVQKVVAGDDPCPQRVKSLAVQAVCEPS